MFCKFTQDAGTAKAVITGKGNYTATVTRTFTIKKATPSVKVSTSTKTVKYTAVKK